MMAQIRTIGVIGAGTMGRGIADLVARSGFSVTLHDAADTAAAHAIGTIRDGLDRDVSKGRITRAEAKVVVGRLASGDLAAAAAADLVIEAALEEITVKQSLFREISQLASPAAILTTNTSSLSIAAIAEAVGDPARFAGLHFFNPPTRIRAVEIVRGPATAAMTIEALRSLAGALGQRAFVVGDTAGFLVNHIGRAFTGEALRMLDEGMASAAEIDRIARDALHFRMGPFELLDLVGLDISAVVAEQVWRAFGEEPRFRPAPIVAKRVALGLFGRKSGGGFYEYDGSGRPLGDAEPELQGVPQPVRLVGFDTNSAQCVAGLFPPDMVTMDPTAIALVGPIGTSAAMEARRLGFDPARTVAIDTVFTDRVTLAGPPDLAAAVAAGVRAAGHPVSVVADGPGMPAQRIAAMMVQVAADAAAAGIGTPEDIDAAARLALAYPRGPFELCYTVGADTIAAIAAGLFALTGDRRWRPSALLARHAQTGVRVARSQSEQELTPN
jgi:3-hydroxybutyryl-CoA dehydrogenase